MRIPLQSKLSDAHESVSVKWRRRVDEKKNVQILCDVHLQIDNTKTILRNSRSYNYLKMHTKLPIWKLFGEKKNLLIFQKLDASSTDTTTNGKF